MYDDINRCEERKKASVHAFVTDLADLFQVKCVIRDISRNGCRIVTSRARDLPKAVQIVPEGSAAPLRGLVVWRRNNQAGVCFEHGCTREQRAEIAILDQALKAERNGDALDGMPPRRPLDYAERLRKHQAAAH